MRVCTRACRMPSCCFRVQFLTSRLDFLNHEAFWASQRRDILLLRREKTLQSDALRWVPIVIQLQWFLCFWFPSSFVHYNVYCNLTGVSSQTRWLQCPANSSKSARGRKATQCWEGQLVGQSLRCHWLYLWVYFHPVDARMSSLLPSQRRSSSLPVWTTRPRADTRPPGHPWRTAVETQVKIWMGTVHSEIANITNRPQL